MRPTPRRRAALAIVLALLGVALAACAAPRAPAREPAGTLRWSLEGVSDISRLDPARLGGNQENIPLYLIFGGLVRINAELQIVGEGAARWTISDDGTLYRFTLRENLRYGNGERVTAQHVADSFARALAPETGTAFALTFLQNVVGAAAVARGEATGVAGITAPDEATLQIRLDSPRGYFLSQLTYGLMFLSPPTIGAGEAWVDGAFGTGPFRVKARVPGESLLLEGNPHYWAGLPGVKEVLFRYFPSTDAALTAYQAGELDVMGSVQAGVPAQRLGEVRGQPGFQTIGTTAIRYIGFNNALPPFNNVYVRQAFAQAVDKEAIARQVLDGTVAPAGRILPSGFPGTGLAVTPLTFDPVGARAALGLAGFVSGNDLPPVTLTFDRGDADLMGVAEALQRDWRETLGVDVRLEPVPLETLIARLDAMIVNPSDARTAMQMYLSVWGADYPDPQNFLSLQLHSGSPYNNGHWSSAEFDRLVDEADRMSADGDQEQRFRLYRDAEQIAVSEVGWLPLYNPQVTLAIRPTVRGLVATVTPQGIVATDWTRVRVEET
jgi:oligopeptide transport system substrate-binding protein